MSPAHVSQSVSDVPAANPEQNEAARGKEFPETGWYLDKGGTQRRKWKPVIFLILWRKNKRKQKETKKAWWVLKISHVVMKHLKDCDKQWNVKKVNSMRFLAIFFLWRWESCRENRI